MKLKLYNNNYMVLDLLQIFKSSGNQNRFISSKKEPDLKNNKTILNIHYLIAQEKFLKKKNQIDNYDLLKNSGLIIAKKEFIQKSNKKYK